MPDIGSTQTMWHFTAVTPGTVSGDDARGVALVGIDHRPPQFDDAVAHDDVDHVPRRPGLAIELGEHRRADRLSLSRPARPRGRASRARAGDWRG